ncbi:MAG TPA: RNA 2',3'-cyclic phosphodiesterase [Vicinamibacterales bacterium]|nr:RNA 2',3'-cyclic phosphodiesterase [Vicinamibacterales bacterium]
MRLFTGIELDAEVVGATGDLIDELARRAGRQAPRARVAWITRERLHVTVRFIGHTDEAGYARIRAVLEPPIEVQPFSLKVERLGWFPPSGQPRVLWAGLVADASLDAVEREVTSRLAQVGVPPEARAYSPHLTLGRVKEAFGLKAAALFHDLADVVLGTTVVEAITLFESRVSSKGPTYLPLQKTRLKMP